jgi:hypothetical protein
VGRDISDIEISAQLWIDVARLREQREQALALVAAGVGHVVLYLNSRQGPAAVDGVVAEIVPALRDAA